MNKLLSESRDSQDHVDQKVCSSNTPEDVELSPKTIITFSYGDPNHPNNWSTVGAHVLLNAKAKAKDE